VSPLTVQGERQRALSTSIKRYARAEVRKPVVFPDFLGAELARVNFASDLSGTRPAWFHACALKYLFANGKKLLCGFAGSQGETTRETLQAHILTGVRVPTLEYLNQIIDELAASASIDALVGMCHLICLLAQEAIQARRLLVIEGPTCMQALHTVSGEYCDSHRFSLRLRKR
jgi:hypothetical protein